MIIPVDRIFPRYIHQGLGLPLSYSQHETVWHGCCRALKPCFMRMFHAKVSMVTHESAVPEVRLYLNAYLLGFAFLTLTKTSREASCRKFASEPAELDVDRKRGRFHEQFYHLEEPRGASALGVHRLSFTASCIFKQHAA